MLARADASEVLDAFRFRFAIDARRPFASDVSVESRPSTPLRRSWMLLAMLPICCVRIVAAFTTVVRAEATVGFEARPCRADVKAFRLASSAVESPGVP